jgi:endonuclease V-like protein UPF0215 family
MAIGSWVKSLFSKLDHNFEDPESPVCDTQEIELPVMSVWFQGGQVLKVDERSEFHLTISDYRTMSSLKSRERASLITVHDGEVVHESVWIGPSWKENFNFSIIH